MFVADINAATLSSVVRKERVNVIIITYFPYELSCYPATLDVCVQQIIKSQGLARTLGCVKNIQTRLWSDGQDWWNN